MFEKFIENYKKKKMAQKIKAEHAAYKRQEQLKAEAKEKAFRAKVEEYSCYPPKVKDGKYMATDKNFFKIVYDSLLKGGPEANLNFINTTYVTNMSYLFSSEGNDKAQKLQLYKRDENVWRNRIEIPCRQFNGDISQWDVSNVRNFEGMFFNGYFNGDISNWNPKSALSMKGMFEKSNFNGDISRWDVSKVIDMSYMFKLSKFDGNISNWDVSNVRNFDSMLDSSQSLISDLSAWDTSNAESMMYMFANIKWSPGIENWNVSKVKNMEGMFKDSYFNEDISNWDVSNVVNMNEMFRSSKFCYDISNWDTHNLEVAADIFYNCPYSGSLLSWNTFKVADLPAMMRRDY